MPLYVLYSDNTKYSGYFTGEKHVFGKIWKKDYSIDYIVDKNIIRAKIYRIKNIESLAKKMSRRDFWGKEFKAIPAHK